MNRLAAVFIAAGTLMGCSTPHPTTQGTHPVTTANHSLPFTARQLDPERAPLDLALPVNARVKARLDANLQRALAGEYRIIDIFYFPGERALKWDGQRHFIGSALDRLGYTGQHEEVKAIDMPNWDLSFCLRVRKAMVGARPVFVGTATTSGEQASPDFTTDVYADFILEPAR